MLERHNGLDPDPDGAFTYYDQAHATIADLQGQLKTAQVERDEQGQLKARLNRDYNLLQNEHLKLYEKVKQEAVYTKQVEIERDALQQRVAQLEGECIKWEASCNLVDAVMERNKLKAELATLQADHARVLGLVQALPVVRGNYSLTVTITGPTRSMEIADAVEALLTYRASLPAQPVCTNHFSDGSKIFPSRECACKPAQPAQGGV